jgi:hypothetical protein
MFVHKKDTTVQGQENRIEQAWDFMFKLDPTGEELEAAVRLFATQCWSAESTQKYRPYAARPVATTS